MNKLFCVFFLSVSLCGSGLGETIYEAPFSIEAVITQTQDPVVKGSTVTISTSSFKVTNKELLNECVSQGIIQSPIGWTIVVYYDAEWDSDSEVNLRLRHRDGSVADISPVLALSGSSGTAVGKISLSKTTASGSAQYKRRFKLIAKYQGYVGECYGVVQASAKFTGTPNNIYEIVSPFTAKMEGTVWEQDLALISATIKGGPFSRK